ncbi:MAG: hypothetical protein ACOYJ1_05420 [Peptococcales bacterium]|jgi:hypothetical protein
MTAFDFILAKKIKRAEDYYNTFTNDSSENLPFELVRSTKLKYFKNLFNPPSDPDKGRKKGYINKLAPIK